MTDSPYRETIERAGRSFVHPKVKELVRVLQEHFHRFNSAKRSKPDPITTDGSNGSVIVFSQFRDSVQEIVKQLNKHKPTINARFFIGQGAKASSRGRAKKANSSPQVARGQNQKQQKQVLYLVNCSVRFSLVYFTSLPCCFADNQRFPCRYPMIFSTTMSVMLQQITDVFSGSRSI